MQLLALIAGYVVVGIVTALGFLILWRIVDGSIDLSLLVSEKTGQASFSRFQFLIFTFVIAIAVLVLTLEAGEFPQLGADILGLLGISGGSYVISKGIQSSGAKQASGRAGMTEGGQ